MIGNGPVENSRVHKNSQGARRSEQSIIGKGRDPVEDSRVALV